MGAYYVIEPDLKVQLDKVAGLGRKLQTSSLFSPENPRPVTVEDVLTAVFENDNLDYTQNDDVLHISGTASGEMRYSDMDTLVSLLRGAVTGVMDIREDDDDWRRCRFHADGTYSEHVGEVIFPTDKEDE
jgi:hypothetical protein